MSSIKFDRWNIYHDPINSKLKFSMGPAVFAYGRKRFLKVWYNAGTGRVTFDTKQYKRWVKRFEDAGYIVQHDAPFNIEAL